MPSSRQQRENAHRKLQRQLERRAEIARKRRQNWIITGSVFAVVVIALGVWVVVANNRSDGSASAAGSSGAAAGTSAATATGCTYGPAAAGGSGVKDVGAPPNTETPVKTGTVTVAVKTSAGDMTFTLDRAKAPCAVESWSYLISKQFYDNTPCHRLTTKGLFVLQCGDPSGTGSGGPSYQYKEEAPAGDNPYGRGVIAMANAGTGTTGSQFFILYKDSKLPASYSVVGTVTSGLEIVDQIAAAGSTPTGDGKPNTPITITSMTASAA